MRWTFLGKIYNNFPCNYKAFAVRVRKILFIGYQIYVKYLASRKIVGCLVFNLMPEWMQEWYFTVISIFLTFYLL